MLLAETNMDQEEDSIYCLAVPSIGTSSNLKHSFTFLVIAKMKPTFGSLPMSSKRGLMVCEEREEEIDALFEKSNGELYRFDCSEANAIITCSQRNAFHLFLVPTRSNLSEQLE